MKGTVKFFDAHRGVGFITPEDDGIDVFVHYSGKIGSGYPTLADGQAVEFEIEQGRRGPQAVSVRPVDGSGLAIFWE